MKPNFPLETLKQSLEHLLKPSNSLEQTKVEVKISNDALEVRPVKNGSFHHIEQVVDFSRAFRMNCYLTYDNEKSHVYAVIF